MDVLVIGGTGPTGIPIVSGLVARGHDVTILHRGLHERPDTPPEVRHLHADPYDEQSLADALGSSSYDVVVAMYGRLRRVAELTRGRAGMFVSVGGVPAYLGWTDAERHTPAGLPVPVPEDAALVEETGIDEKGYRIVRTERAVFAAHPEAVHFRYPYMYGPHQPVPREWLIVRRILDGRRRLVVPDGGLTLHHHGYTENCAAALLAAIDHPERARGTIFNVADEEVLTVRQVAELCAAELAADLELVSMPYDLAVPAWPLLGQPSANHRVLDLTRLHAQLGHRDVLPAREAVRRTARWLADNKPAPGGPEEIALTDPFDYDNEDRLIDAWCAARASVTMPEFPQQPWFGMAYSGPLGRPRMHKEFAE